MFKQKSGLATITEQDCGQHYHIPGAADRIAADMPHIGVKSLAAGDREKDTTEDGKAGPTGSPQETDRILRINRF